MRYLLVFLATTFVDVAWTKYTLAVAAKHAVRASLWSTIIVAVGAFSVLSYTQDNLALIPAAAGAFVGTFWAVRREK